MLQRMRYDDLNSRQKENYNYQKVAAHLADYGFNCMWLNDDWQGADFIACHIDGSTFLKIQLKGRLTIDKKYRDKEIYVAFNNDGNWYLYPHDKVQNDFLAQCRMSGTRSWDENGAYSWPSIPSDLGEYMAQYAI